MITLEKPKIVSVKKYEFESNAEDIKKANSQIRKALEESKRRYKDGLKNALDFRC